MDKYASFEGLGTVFMCLIVICAYYNKQNLPYLSDHNSDSTTVIFQPRS